MANQKILTVDEANEKAIQIFATLQDADQAFSFQRRRVLGQMIFTSVQDCDTVKHFVPGFQMKLDSRQNRYAEYIIEYDNQTI